MGIDINLLRKEKGNDPEVVIESEKKRFRNPEQNFAEKTVEIDQEWRKKRFELDNASKDINSVQKDVTKAKIDKIDCTDLLNKLEKLKISRENLEQEERTLIENRDIFLKRIGNLVHESVIVSKDENLNGIVRTWGTIPDIKVETGSNRYAHHQLLAMIDGFDAKRGQKIAGHRGYFLKGMGALMNMALISYGMTFLTKKEYTVIHTPFFMKKSIMAETCQLSDYDEQLYKVTTGTDEADNEFYLIATSEQPISAYFYKEQIEAKELPLRFCGFSTCFRKEAGAHGKDNLGIFRVHQFEKIEQFSITEPEDSWAEHERMIKTSEEFYMSLNLPYRVVSIVSGELNDAAAKKYDLEAWFPSYKAYRELVSCSNCTDFQSRGLDIKCFGAKKEEKVTEESAEQPETKNAKKTKQIEEKNNRYVHMLNGTLCATERTLCCILENYQTDTGITVPEVLRPFMGIDFIPFINKPVIEEK